MDGIRKTAIETRLLSAWTETEDAGPDASWHGEHLAHASARRTPPARTDLCDDLCDELCDQLCDVEATDVVDDVARDDELADLEADGEPDDFDADLAIDADESHDAFTTDD